MRTKKDFEMMKTSELMDIDKTITDDESCDHVEVLWKRNPFEVLEEQYETQNKLNSKLEIRIKNLEKTIELQDRVLVRIDRLTQAILKKK